MPDFPKIGGASAAEVAAAILVDPGTDKIDGSQVDAAISSRSTLTQAQIDTTPFAGGDVATVKAKTNLIPADITTQLDTNIPAVKAKTDNLPTDPASDTQVNTRASGTDYTAGRAAKMDKIQDFLEEGLGTLTATGALQTVREYTGTGKLHIYIDLFLMAGGDITVITQSMKIKAAGTYRVYAQETYTGAQALALLHIVMKPSKNGVKVELQQTAGANKSYDWETFVEQAAA